MCRTSKFLFLTVFPALVTAGQITYTFNFSSSDLSFSKSREYDVVEVKNGISREQIGNPDLPHLQKFFVIPANAEVEKIEILEHKSTKLEGTYKILPVQDAQINSKSGSQQFRAPNPAIYSSVALYPAKSIDLSQSGSISGFRITGVDLAPLRYQPGSGKLHLTTKVTIAVHYEAKRKHLPIISKRQYHAAAPLVHNIVQNRADLSRCSPEVRADALTDVNYAIIVADDSYKSGFDPFKLWKTKKGLKTEVFTTSWIYSKYTGGYDNAEKIRNFLKDYHATKGLIYVLLAGDYDKVPHRVVTCKYGGGTSASDYYFGDLDDNWDANNNHMYGEPTEDKVDGFYDIYPGRLPLDNKEQIAVFIHKDTTMEKCPPLAGQKKQLLVSTHNFGKHHGSRENNFIADSCSTDWTNVKLEDPSSSNAIRDSLNKEFYMLHIHTHGYVDGFVNANNNIFNNSDVKTLTNKSFPILYSASCDVGEFDNVSKDCIGEYLINQPNGGCVATVLNTRFGVSFEDKTFQGSDLLSINLAYMFFKQDTFTIGQAVAAAKHLVRDAAWKTFDHWSYVDPQTGETSSGISYSTHFVVNNFTLFGDPDLPIFKQPPSALSVTHVKSASKGNQNYTITVSGSGTPIQRALVCCYKDGEVHQSGYTDGSGEVILAINPASNGIMYVTVTSKNRYPYEGICSIGESAANVFANKSHSSLFSMQQDARGAEVSYTLANRTSVEAALFSANGKRVELLKNSMCNPGSYQLRIDRGMLKDGFYFLKFRAGDLYKTEKLLLVH